MLKSYTNEYDVSLQINDPIASSHDKMGHALALLRRYYEKCNYMGSFITSVDSIVHCSDIRINSVSPDIGDVDVRFRATVVTLKEGDFLPDVKVEASAQILVGIYSSPRTAIGIMKLPNVTPDKQSAVMHAVAKCTKIPIMLRGVRHNPMMPEVSAIGYPYVRPEAPRVVWQVTGRYVPPAEHASLAALQSELDWQLAHTADSDYTFFAKLYRVAPAVPAPETGVSILDLATGKCPAAGSWTRAVYATHVLPANVSAGTPAYPMSAAQFVDQMVYDCTHQLAAIRLLSQHYKSGEQRDEAKALWDALAKL